MTRWLLPLWSCLLFSLSASPARAQSGDAFLSWSECRAKGGTFNLDSPCVSDEGFHSLIGSFVVANPITQLVGIEASLLVSTLPPCDGPGPCEGGDLPSWWQFQPGGCREGSLGCALNFGVPPWSLGSGCANPWAGKLSAANASVTYPFNPTYPYGTGLSKEKLVASGGVYLSSPATVAAGVETYAFRLDVDHQHTAGAGACADCCAMTFITLGSLKLLQSAGVGDVYLYPASYPGYISWQQSQVPCGPTPVARRSWGAVKSQYR